jgi:diaminohydroxyphosphoribosylaminopyrimidine deaminase / 5-amino-6-(5-phosphoribosylamino)uracil reductase
MTERFDDAMMRRALFHAARGQGRTTPNPMVGAVVVSAHGVVVGHGWHERAGGPHAEVHALDAAGERSRGGTLYVTLEPCCHRGRTGPCTERVIAAGITRVVAAMCDPDPRVNGRGFARLREQGIAVEEGVCAADAARLNAAFVTVTTRRRPLVICKAATSLDGRVARRPGERTAITSQGANRRTQVLRAAVDAIAVGSETVLVDDPLLTARECHRVRPLIRVVFDRRLRTPAAARLFTTLSEGPVIIMTRAPRGAAAQRAAALEAVGATVVDAPTVGDALSALLARDVSTVLVEGGPRLQAALWEAKVIDRLHLIVASHVLGPDATPWLDDSVAPRASWSRLTVDPRGPDTWIEADVHGTG